MRNYIKVVVRRVCAATGRLAWLIDRFFFFDEDSDTDAHNALILARQVVAGHKPGEAKAVVFRLPNVDADHYSWLRTVLPCGPGAHRSHPKVAEYSVCVRCGQRLGRDNHAVPLLGSVPADRAAAKV